MEKKLQYAFIQFSHCTWPTSKWTTHLHTNFLLRHPFFSKLGGSKMIQPLHCRPVELASNLVIIAIPQGIYPGILVKDRDPPKWKSVILLVIKFVDLGPGMYHPKPYLLFRSWKHSSFQHQQLEFSQKSSNHRSDQISKPPHLYPHGSLNFFKNPNQKKEQVPYPPPCWVQGSKLLPHLDLSVRPWQWAVGSYRTELFCKGLLCKTHDSWSQVCVF